MDVAQIKEIGEIVFEAIHSGKFEKVEQAIFSLKKGQNSGVKKDIYPDLNEFVITNEDIEFLKKNCVLNNENQITAEALRYVKKSNNALLKLLYAFCWKNENGLKKISRLAKGIEKANTHPNLEGETNFVLYQFGRHLANWPRSEPLIDQHSIRAFLVLKKLEKIKNQCAIHETLKEICKIDSVKLKRQWVESYVTWFKTLMLKNNDPKFLRDVDELLMLFGKAIKE